jgi:hypothetical protein
MSDSEIIFEPLKIQDDRDAKAGDELAKLRSMADVIVTDGPGPFISFPSPIFDEVLPSAGGVEYDIVGKGGAVETVKAGQIEGVPNPELLAQRRLAQMQMVTRILRKMKRKGINAEAQANRVKKNRKKAKLAKVSRKKNR